MKIAILTVYQIYSNKIVKDLIEKFGDEIVLIAESGVLLQDKTLLNSLKRYLKKSGLTYVFTQAFKLQLFKIISTICSRFSNNYHNKFYSYRALAWKRKLNIRTVVDVNSKGFMRILKKEKVNLIVSVYFNQILKDFVIDTANKGVINIHPAYLPDYKGVSPVFWSLANGEKYAGVTVHYINKGIDTGNIIAREKVKIARFDTEDSLYWRIGKIGSPLLAASVKKIENGKVKPIPNIGGRYFSLPSKEAVSKYRKNRTFFNIKDFLFTN